MYDASRYFLREPLPFGCEIKSPHVCWCLHVVGVGPLKLVFFSIVAQLRSIGSARKTVAVYCELSICTAEFVRAFNDRSVVVVVVVVRLSLEHVFTFYMFALLLTDCKVAERKMWKEVSEKRYEWWRTRYRRRAINTSPEIEIHTVMISSVI